MEAIGDRGDIDLSASRPLDEVRSGYSRFNDGDVVIAKITPCFENGKGGVIQRTMTGVGFGTTELYVLTPAPCLDSRFLYYVTAQPEFRRLGAAFMTGAAGQQRVPEEFVRDYRIPIPPILRQRAIADYLDRETARIDALIAAKVRLLDLLGEKRRALITHAVTRGLDPDVPLRDSGVPWLGKIPAHWEVTPLRFLVDFVSGATPDTATSEFWDGAIPWVSAKDMKSDLIDDTEDHVSELAISKRVIRAISPFSVLVVVRGMILAHSFPTAVTRSRVTINQDLKALRCGAQLFPFFLRDYLSGTENHVLSITGESAHGTKKLETDVLRRLPMAVPPISEQRAISRHIGEAVCRLDRLEFAARNSLKLLRERRSALIAAAVTGQIDVEAAA